MNKFIQACLVASAFLLGPAIASAAAAPNANCQAYLPASCIDTQVLPIGISGARSATVGTQPAGWSLLGSASSGSGSVGASVGPQVQSGIIQALFTWSAAPQVIYDATMLIPQGTYGIPPVAWQSASSGASTTTPTATFANPPLIGDLIVAIIYSATNSGTTDTPPAVTKSPWQLLASDGSGPVTYGADVWYRYQQAGDPSSWTFTISGTNANSIILIDVANASQAIAPLINTTNNGGTPGLALALKGPPVNVSNFGGEQAITSDSVVDSIGTNLQSDFPITSLAAQTILGNSGIRHLRFGDAYYQPNQPAGYDPIASAMKRLHQQYGIDYASSGTAIAMYGQYNRGQIYLPAMQGYVDAVGGPSAIRYWDITNEPDTIAVQGGMLPCTNPTPSVPNPTPSPYQAYCWTQPTLQLYQGAYAQYKSLDNVPVLGPSFAYDPTSYAPYLVGLSAVSDFANLHDYNAPRQPEASGPGTSACLNTWSTYNSMACAIADYQAVLPNTQTISTEIGFFGTWPGFPAGSGPGSNNNIPDVVTAIYEDRLFLYGLIAGKIATYQFDYQDSTANGCSPTMTSGGCLGIVGMSGTPKPSYYVLQSMIQLLNDKGYVFTPGRLNYSIKIPTGSSGSYHLLTQNHKGTYILAVWNGSLDFLNNTVSISAPVPTTITVDGSIQSVRLNTYNPSYTLSQSYLTPVSSTGKTNTYALNTTDQVQFLEMSTKPTIP